MDLKCFLHLLCVFVKEYCNRKIFALDVKENLLEVSLAPVRNLIKSNFFYAHKLWPSDFAGAPEMSVLSPYPMHFPSFRRSALDQKGGIFTHSIRVRSVKRKILDLVDAYVNIIRLNRTNRIFK